MQEHKGRKNGSTRLNHPKTWWHHGRRAASTEIKKLSRGFMTPGRKLTVWRAEDLGPIHAPEPEALSLHAYTAELASGKFPPSPRQKVTFPKAPCTVKVDT